MSNIKNEVGSATSEKRNRKKEEQTSIWTSSLSHFRPYYRLQVISGSWLLVFYQVGWPDPPVQLSTMLRHWHTRQWPWTASNEQTVINKRIGGCWNSVNIFNFTLYTDGSYYQPCRAEKSLYKQAKISFIEREYTLYINGFFFFLKKSSLQISFP